MLNKIKKIIANAKFNCAQKERFNRALDQNFDSDNNFTILAASILVGIVAAGCFWIFAMMTLESEKSKIQKELEQESQEFYSIIKETYKL